MAVLFDKRFQAIDANGNPYAGAKLFFYLAGTSTAVTSYQDSDETTPHASPVVADSSGTFAAIYLPELTSYKYILKDADDVTVNTVDGWALAPSVNTWATQPIGVPIPIFAHLYDSASDALPPTDQYYRYILLSAGETGAGEYNEGVLTNESVSGSYPLVIATADIDYSTSPINGKTVNLINSEGRALVGGTTAGVVRMDQMQQITGNLGTTGSGGLWGSLASDGAFTATNDGAANQPDVGANTARTINFDSANSTDSRTGSETHGKDISALFVLRIA